MCDDDVVEVLGASIGEADIRSAVDAGMCLKGSLAQTQLDALGSKAVLEGLGSLRQGARLEDVIAAAEQGNFDAALEAGLDSLEGDHGGAAYEYVARALVCKRCGKGAGVVHGAQGAGNDAVLGGKAGDGRTRTRRNEADVVRIACTVSGDRARCRVDCRDFAAVDNLDLQAVKLFLREERAIVYLLATPGDVRSEHGCVGERLLSCEHANLACVTAVAQGDDRVDRRRAKSDNQSRLTHEAPPSAISPDG